MSSRAFRAAEGVDAHGQARLRAAPPRPSPPPPPPPAPARRASRKAKAIPIATDSPCVHRRKPPAASTPWPKVWPRLRSLRSPCSRGSRSTTSSFTRAQAAIIRSSTRPARARAASRGRAAPGGASRTSAPRRGRCGARAAAAWRARPGRRARATGGWKAPTAFLASGRFTAVLPPSAASTMARTRGRHGQPVDPAHEDRGEEAGRVGHRAAAQRHHQAAPGQPGRAAASWPRAPGSASVLPRSPSGSDHGRRRAAPPAPAPRRPAARAAWRARGRR